MTWLALVLLLLAGAAPLLRLPLRRTFRDPTVLLAAFVAVLLALAAVCAALVDGPVHEFPRGAAVVLAMLVAAGGGSEVVRATFRLTRGEVELRRRAHLVPGTPTEREPESDPGSEAADPATRRLQVDERVTQERAPQQRVVEPPSPPDPSEGILRGGLWIGYLERVAIAATLLAAWPEGMALVLALKGVGRYPELRGPEAATGAPEAFIIGTLASVLWAAAAAGVGWLLVH